MAAFVTACAGFLLAVLWFDLMFDVQVRGGATPEAVESIATYYARVTRAAAPMNRLVMAAMFGLFASLGFEIARGSIERWASVGSLALAIPPIALAGIRTVPTAVRIGQRLDPVEVRMRATVTVLHQHVFCFVCIASVIVLQLVAVS